jgi:N-acetyl-anhydromuramyl-L-alanine amidase AmpD
MSGYITYNAGNATAAKVTHDYEQLAALDVDVIGSQEVSDRGSIIAHAPGMTGIQLRTKPNSAHVALNVRDGLTVAGVDLKPLNKLTWVGRLVAGARKSGKSKAKYILSALVDGRRIGVTHLVPSWTKKRCILARRLARKQVAGCVEWFNAGGQVLMMDGNGPATHKVFAPLRKVAVPYARGKSHGIERDIIWVAKDAAADVDVEALSGYSSDHPPVEADVAWKTTAPTPKPTPAPKPKPAPKPPKEDPVTDVKIAAFLPAPNSGGHYTKVLLVVHDTEGPEQNGAARDVVAYWNKERTGSTQFIIDNREIIQAVAEDAYAWSAGTTANKYGIHVEHVGFASQRRAQWLDAYSSAELGLSAPLFAELGRKHGIPLRRLTVEQIRHAVATGKPADGGICGHADITKAFPGETSHTDPGPNFPWDRFMQMVAGGGQPSEEDDVQLTDELYPGQKDKNVKVIDLYRSEDKFIDRTDGRLKAILALLDPEKLADEIAAKVNVKAGVTADQVKQAVKDALREGVDA